MPTYLALQGGVLSTLTADTENQWDSPNGSSFSSTAVATHHCGTFFSSLAAGCQCLQVCRAVLAISRSTCTYLPAALNLLASSFFSITYSMTAHRNTATTGNLYSAQPRAASAASLSVKSASASGFVRNSPTFLRVQDGPPASI